MLFVIEGGVSITLDKVDRYFNRLASYEAVGLYVNLNCIVVPLLDPSDV